MAEEKLRLCDSYRDHGVEEEEEEEEEEEALSFCDLPVNLNREEKVKSSEEEEGIKENESKQEDFNFNGCVSSRSELCAADDIFLKGQILPFRLSVSSENGIIIKSKQQNSNSKPSKCSSRSESMDHGSLAGFTNFSSSSSSSRSQFSSSSSNSSSFNPRNSNSRIQNHFLPNSSPKPQIRMPNYQNRNRKSTVWKYFRLSLVRAPEIELQDLKARNSVCRNCGTSSSSSNVSNSNQMEKQGSKQSFIEKRLLLSGCNCTVSSVKPIPMDIILIKRNEERNNKKNQKNGGKQAMSRHRTFEWINELSNSSFLDDHEEAHIA